MGECRGVERERPNRGLGRTQEILLLLRMIHGKEKIVTKRGEWVQERVQDNVGVECRSRVGFC